MFRSFFSGNEQEIGNKLESIISNNFHDGDNENKLSAMEAASAFDDLGVEILSQQYACLKNTPQEIVEMISQEVMGQEEAIKKLVFTVYYNQFVNFIDELGYGSLKRLNILLIGPTGCGKTSSVNALKKIFRVPVAIYTSDSITSAGYIGNKVEDILIRLFEESGRDLPLAERGIIFIDEFDKKTNSPDSVGKDVNGKAVQQELLKFFDSSQIDLTLPNKQRVHFNTDKLTIILGGAFVDLDKIREKRFHKKTLGFISDNNDENDNEKCEEKREYISQDLIDYGFIPEIVGRVVIIDEFRELNEDDIFKIMLEGKNSPYRQKTWLLANFLNVDISISKKFLKRIAKNTIDMKTGARALEEKITKVFQPIFEDAFEHATQEGICEISEDGSYYLMYDDVTYYGVVSD